MKPRPYQQKLIDAVHETLATARSTLAVLFTGGGKTICFSHIADYFSNAGRVMVLAHREELINQAAEKIAAVTGHMPDKEMGEQWADQPNMHGHRAKFVVSSIQTQISGRGGKGRMTRFSPHDFSLLIIDEAHHACAASYKRVIEHYQQNPDLKVLGVTATPDRADEEALGQVFDRVAYVYEINDGIGDGWLVPIQQRSVLVDGLDFSRIKTTAGDLNGAELAAVMEYEENLHKIAHPTYELAAGRKTLVFAASVAHAERLCEIFNRHKENCARFICGKTDDVVRRHTLKDFRNGVFQFLVNVAVLTEGYDEPTVEVIAVARPTKSRALYAQVVGRGTRPLPGLIDHLDSAEDRIASIAASAKPCLEVLDFVGNAGRHKLVTCADILGGNYPEAVVSLANSKAQEADEPVDMRKMLELAEAELEKRREEAERRRQAEAANRAKLLARASYAVENIDAFDVLDIQPARVRGWDKGQPPSEKQIELLRKFGIPNAAELSGTHARQLIGTMLERSRNKKATLKMARILKRHGYDPDMSFADARKTIDALAANGWRRPAADLSALVGATEGVL